MDWWAWDHCTWLLTIYGSLAPPHWYKTHAKMQRALFYHTGMTEHPWLSNIHGILHINRSLICPPLVNVMDLAAPPVNTLRRDSALGCSHCLYMIFLICSMLFIIMPLPNNLIYHYFETATHILFCHKWVSQVYNPSFHILYCEWAMGGPGVK